MRTANNILKTVLKFIIGESVNVCRLCFDTTNSAAISLEDDKKFASPYFVGVITYENMLMDLGVSREPSMPLQLCPKCADQVTDAYLFQKQTQYSNEKWKEVLKKINNTLDLSNQLRNNVQTVHLIMRDKESHIFTSRQRSSLETKQETLNKVKSFLRHKNKTKRKPPQLPIICEVSGKMFSSNVHLARHKRSEKRYVCNDCPNKVFKLASTLKSHIDVYHTPKTLQCSQCAKMVSTERLLNLHYKMEHVASLCNLCSIEFPSKKALLRHLNKHGKHKCMKCQKLFSHKHSFQVHVKICGNPDTNQRVFCDICHQSYKFKNGLRTHLKIKHGFGREYYSCSWCPKKFDAASRLRNHIVKHTRERNFHCEKCGGMFVTHAALVYHSRLHTGEKPFKCDMCSERFLSASRRLEHKRRKHLGPQQQCPFCDSKFVTGYCLRKHVIRHQNPQSKLFIGETGQIESKRKNAVNLVVKYELE